MKRLKVVTVVGTRPEIIRLSRVIVALERDTDHVLVHTGQNYDYELNQVFFEDLGLRNPDVYLEAAGETPAQTIGMVIERFDRTLREVAPDAVLILGDTNSCLAAYPAKRRKVPVFHMEAGNRCFDERVPEEINRRIVDHISDVNMPYSSIAREYLLREGLPADRVIKTGSPMYEVLHHYRGRIEASKAAETLSLRDREFFLVSFHREENVDDPAQLARAAGILNGLALEERAEVVVSTHPRTRKRLEVAGVPIETAVRLLKPLGFSDYVHLQTRARAVLSDSGTISEESAIMNFPALNLREAHERPEAMEEGAVMMVGLSWERVRQGLRVLESQRRGDSRTIGIPADYDVPNVSEKVVRVVLSYVDYVNQRVWRRGPAPARSA
jgi:UDP-N-acetylglucosamine 2-epimerase (non-hydrolysing)